MWLRGQLSQVLLHGEHQGLSDKLLRICEYREPTGTLGHPFASGIFLSDQLCVVTVLLECEGCAPPSGAIDSLSGAHRFPSLGLGD